MELPRSLMSFIKGASKISSQWSGQSQVQAVVSVTDGFEPFF